MPAHKIPLEVRFWQKVEKSDGCWIWNAARHPFGYGHIKIDGKVAQAHRVSYEMSMGPIPDGLVLDHLCRNPSCVRPDHLEPVSLTENTMRGEGYMARHARKTHCANGHEFTPANTYYRSPGRRCRTCQRHHELSR